MPDTPFPPPLQLPALLGILLVSLSHGGGVAGWFLFVGVSYLIYITIIFVVEFFIPGVHVHKLVVSWYWQGVGQMLCLAVLSPQDGIVSALYTLLWLIAAIVATTYAACFGSGKLGVASVRLLCSM